MIEERVVEEAVDKFFNDNEDLIIEYNENNNGIVCKNCGLVDTIINCNINYVCSNCGIVQDVLMFEKWRYVFGVDYISKYTRYGHWKKILRSVQGGLVCSIPDEVMKEIKTKKFNTIQELKAIMIKLRLRKYYLSIYWIFRQCKNRSLIEFRKMTYLKLLRLFQEISSAFNELEFNDDRKNFFNYHYVLIKMLRIVGEENHIKHLFCMKDYKKIRYSEKLFKRICDKLDLEFIPEPNIKKKKKKKRNKNNLL